MSESSNSKRVRNTCNHPPAFISTKKKVRKENVENENIRHAKNKFTNLRICHECADPIECEYYYEWFVLKYANDPSLQNVSRNKWRDVIHAEYRLLSNFNHFKKHAECGCVSKHFNTKQGEDLPVCLYNRVEGFIDFQIREQSLKWHEHMIDKLSYSEVIQKDFIKQTLDPKMRVDHFCKWVGTNRKPQAMD